MANKNHDFPVQHIRRLLEPGPVVLVTSAYKGEQNIMTMGWHTVMEFTPSLVGCVISSGNHTFELIRKSKQCVINVPTAKMLDTVVAIGNSTGKKLDKFDEFNLTAVKASKVQAPMIGECYANLECEIYDGKMISKYNYFIFKVVKAHVASTTRMPNFLHYYGQGLFGTSCRVIDKSAGFTKYKRSATF